MGNTKLCCACAAPLTPDVVGPNPNCCRHCTDEQGNVRPRETIQAGLAQWFRTWQPNLDDETAMVRAEHYMKAMPHWA